MNFRHLNTTGNSEFIKKIKMWWSTETRLNWHTGQWLQQPVIPPLSGEGGFRCSVNPASHAVHPTLGPVHPTLGPKRLTPSLGSCGSTLNLEGEGLHFTIKSQPNEATVLSHHHIALPTHVDLIEIKHYSNHTFE